MPSQRHWSDKGRKVRRRLDQCHCSIQCRQQDTTSAALPTKDANLKPRTQSEGHNTSRASASSGAAATHQLILYNGAYHHRSRRVLQRLPRFRLLVRLRIAPDNTHPCTSTFSTKTQTHSQPPATSHSSTSTSTSTSNTLSPGPNLPQQTPGIQQSRSCKAGPATYGAHLSEATILLIVAQPPRTKRELWLIPDVQPFVRACAAARYDLLGNIAAWMPGLPAGD
jgi:hypothetical protein